jgi:hypothetical protein
MSFKDDSEYIDLMCWRHGAQSDHGRLFFASQKDPLTKVLVTGDQDPPGFDRRIYDSLVAGIARKQLRDPLNVVSGIFERLAGGTRNRAVHKESHTLTRGRLAERLDFLL